MGNPFGLGDLFAFLLVDDLTDAIRIAELVRMTGPDESGSKDLLEAYSFLPLVNVLGHLRPAWIRQGQFKYEATTVLQKALYAFWAKASLARVCKNWDRCPAPFFIARKTQQLYCSDECAAPARLEAKKKWWDKVGKERREEETRKKPKKRSGSISRRKPR